MENFTFDFDKTFASLESNPKSSNQPTEKCFLCNKLRKTFYCKKCVGNGDFIHSTSRFSERFAEKRLRLMRALTTKAEISGECEKRLETPKIAEDKVEEIRARKERIKILQSHVADIRKKVARKKKLLKEAEEFNDKCRRNLLENLECREDLKRRADVLERKQPEMRQCLAQFRPRLKQTIRMRVNELVKYIFPISEMQTSVAISKEDSREDIRNELAEATRTAYIRGRWVVTDSWGESQHIIVAPSLPDSGDYSPYIHWVTANKDMCIANATSTEVDHNPAYNISAALSYTTQLTNILAYFLDLRLPNKLCYSEFGETHLNERKFAKCVTQLNANILWLCLSQNVNTALLHPSRTICNLLLLLNPQHCELGRQEVVEVDPQCVSFFDELLTQQVREATSRLSVSSLEEDERDILDMESVGDADDDDSDHVYTDWEAVPLVACAEAVPSPDVSRKSRAYPLAGTGHIIQTTSMAGTLVHSAAAGFASFWRGWTANK